MTARAALALPLLVLGCATAQPPAEPLSREQAAQIDQLEAELRRLDAEVGRLDAQPHGTGCDRILAARDAICDLAGRICAIAVRHPEDAGTQARCDDGQVRCRRAAATAATRCGAPLLR